MTTGVPLPEPHGYFESAPPRMYTADQMHSHATAVSAADNAALAEAQAYLMTRNKALREALQMAMKWATAMTKDEYAQCCAALKESQHG